MNLLCHTDWEMLCIISKHMTLAFFFTLSIFIFAIYAVCTLKPYSVSMYSLIILYVTRPFGFYTSALLAILSSDSLPSPSPNSTFTFITLSGYLWESITTVSTRNTWAILYKNTVSLLILTSRLSTILVI